MDTDKTDKTPETAEDQPKQETPASGQGAIAANSRGDLIRKTRMTREKPLSCAELAGLIGVSTATMSLIERDKCPVGDARLAKIAKVLSIPLDVLQREKGAVVSSLTAWQQHLQKKYSLDNEELATLLQIAIEAKLYRYDAPDTRSLMQWERFYAEMRNFLPRTTIQDRMLQNETLQQLIGQQKNESPDDALGRYLREIDALVDTILEEINYNFTQPPSQSFLLLYYNAIRSKYRTKVIIIDNETNTDEVKQQLFSLNIPEAIGSFFSLTENTTLYTATHTVENAPDGIRRHLILLDKRNDKKYQYVPHFWRALTEIILGTERMNHITSFAETDPEAVDWLLDRATAQVEFPPSILSKLIATYLPETATKDLLPAMMRLHEIYGPFVERDSVFGACTRQAPFPLCFFNCTITALTGDTGVLKIENFYASPSATEKGLVIQEGITIQKHRYLVENIYKKSERLLNLVVLLDSSVTADFRLPESFIGTSVRIVAQIGPSSNALCVFLVPDFTNTPVKDPYADW